MNIKKIEMKISVLNPSTSTTCVLEFTDNMSRKFSTTSFSVSNNAIKKKRVVTKKDESKKKDIQFVKFKWEYLETLTVDELCSVLNTKFKINQIINHKS